MKPCLRFSLNDAHYAVDAASVQEIFWLPELTLVDEVPPYIAGVINLRGRITPVMDLALRLGHTSGRRQLSDCVVLLQTDGVAMGIIVSAVQGMVEIPDTEVEPPVRYDDDAARSGRFLAGNAKVDDEIIMLLDVPHLIHAPEPRDSARLVEPAYFCPDATAAERDTFRNRAHVLMQVDKQATADRFPLSVIQLGTERFGVSLDVVREFCHLRQATPIPCCPPHIAGNMNLRGDILTLADIRMLLNITAGNATEIMVVESGDLHVGVPVDKVLEVTYAQPADILPVPDALPGERKEYCKGVMQHEQGMLCILDLEAILTKGGMEVEEEV